MMKINRGRRNVGCLKMLLLFDQFVADERDLTTKSGGPFQRLLRPRRSSILRFIFSKLRMSSMFPSFAP
jgi:hypothetical protein